MGGMGGGLALNQLLVVMDGIDNPPFFKRVFTNKTNAVLDAIYFVPRRLGKVTGMLFGAIVALTAAVFLVSGLGAITGSPIIHALSPAHWIIWRLLFVGLEVLVMYLGVEAFRNARKTGTLSMRLPRAKPTGAQIYFIGATNVPVQNLDPALTRPGRMGRHITFRTPTKEDRKDIFDLYLAKVAHDPDLDSDARRDEIARITSGYSPAMIDQICSMALTNAHHEGQAAFTWRHLVDSMVVIESGTAINVNYNEPTRARSRSTRPGTPQQLTSTCPRSSRAGSRSRCAAGASATISRSRRRSASVPSRAGSSAADPRRRGHGRGARLLRRELGRRVGDLSTTTWTATSMVGASGMSPLPIDLGGKTFADETEEQTRERVMRRLEDIGSAS